MTDLFDLLLYYLGSVFVVALIAFCVIWWRQISRHPTSLGVFKLLGLFAIIWGVCFAILAILRFSTALSGASNTARLEDIYIFVAGLIGYTVGNSVIGRMLKSKS